MFLHYIRRAVAEACMKLTVVKQRYQVRVRKR